MTLAAELHVQRPVVLLHAFPLSRRMWQPQLQALHRAGFSPVAVDLPGFGESPLQGPPTLEAFARAVLDTLDRLQVAQAVWVGLSMGGYVLMRVLEMAPERVLAAVFADTRAEPDSPEARARRFDQAARVATGGPEALVDSFVEAALGPTTRTRRPQVVETVRQLILANRAAAIIHALHAMAARPDSSEVLRRTSVPALVVVGQEDALTPPAVARQLAGLLRQARYVELEGAGHLPNLETPDAFNGALLSFLQDLPAA